LAAKNGQTQFIKLFLDEHPKSLQLINSLNSNIESPLSLAVSNNHLESTELLLKYGARVSSYLFFLLYIYKKTRFKDIIYLTFFYRHIFY
jgi:ankyrin repeat protein